jgi:ribosome-binding factor A
MTSRRQERVAELLFEELSILISSELMDESLADAMLTVTAVEVTPDLRNARIFFEHALPAGQSRHVIAALRRSAGFLRRSLLENLNLRYMPELTFHVDLSGEHGRRIDALLNSIALEADQGQEDDTTEDAE